MFVSKQEFERVNADSEDVSVISLAIKKHKASLKLRKKTSLQLAFDKID